MKKGNSGIVFEPIRRSDIQDMVGCKISSVKVNPRNCSILFVVENQKGEKAGYGFQLSEFCEDLIISRGTVQEM